MASKSKIEVLLTAEDAGLLFALKRSQQEMKRLGTTAEQESKKAKSSFAGLASLKIPLVGAAVGAGIAYYANEVRKVADEYTNLDSRLKLVTSSHEEFALVRERLYQISQETGTEYAANADSYSKLARSIKDLGGTAEETLSINELVNKSLIVNGSSTQMAASFQLQFAQAMGSGVLQGDEFRAMLESNSFFAGELAKALGTNIGGLRAMSKEGQLTSDVLRGAFPKMAEVVNSEFGKIAPTTQRALAVLENAYKRIIDESNKAGNGTGSITESLIGLAQTIDQNREGIISLFSKMIDLASKTVGAVANIGQSLAGWSAVFDGKLSFFEFATMDAKDLNEWLKTNVKTLKETSGEAEKAGSAIAASSQKAAGAQKQITAEAIKEMKSQYKKYTDDIKKLQESLADNQRSTAEELRDMGRSGMSDIQAWQDRNREAGEFTIKAREAAAAGKQLSASGDIEGGKQSFAVAIQYADKARTAYKSLNEEVKSGDRVVMDSATALKTAMAGVEQAGSLKDSIIQQQIASLEASKQALNVASGGVLDDSVSKAKEGLQSLGTAADEMKGKVQEAMKEAFTPPEGGDWGPVWDAMESGSNTASKAVSSTWDKTWDDFLASGSEDIASLEKKLQALAEDRYVTVHIQEVEGRQNGGLIQRFARGGKLPGYGGGDRISALLEAGEFVVRKEAVSKFGTGIFHALNNLRLPEIPKFALGGPVGFSTGGPVSAPSGYTASFAFIDQSGQPGSVHGSEIDIKRLEAAVNKHNRFRSSNR